MSLSERLKHLKPALGPNDCRTCVWLDQQTVKDQAAFWSWLDEGKPPGQLRRECAEEGLEVSDTSFARHVKNPRHRLHSADVKQKAS